jgi:hypothetical protein
MYLQTTLTAEENLENVQFLLKEQTINIEEEFEDRTTTTTTTTTCLSEILVYFHRNAGGHIPKDSIFIIIDFRTSNLTDTIENCKRIFRPSFFPENPGGDNGPELS